MNKKNFGLYLNWYDADATTIEEAYERPSINKVRAYEECVEKSLAMHGFWDAIPSHNTFQFSYAFLYENKESGKIHMHYITKANVYDFPLDFTEEQEEWKLPYREW